MLGGELVFLFDAGLHLIVGSRREESDIKIRHLGVAFENLRVVGLGSSASFQPTLGSLLNPLSILSALKTLRHPPLRDILSGFEGVVRPGEMLRSFKFLCVHCTG